MKYKTGQINRDKFGRFTNGNSGDITTTGTQLKLKTTATIADSEHIHIRGWGCYVK